MKLLKLKIGKMKESFRSLYSGFEICFHSLEKQDLMKDFNPFCFAGLNGSGKSNVLEALSSIFYHLELCVAQYKPQGLDNFDRKICIPNAFELEYIIPIKSEDFKDIKNWFKVVLIKEENREPVMQVTPYPFDDSSEIISVSLEQLIKDEPVEGKKYLPDHIVAYSSGENEILSLPFIKSRLLHLDEYKHSIEKGYKEYIEPENSLIYIDNNMSQAVLLSCLLFENIKTLEPITNEVGIIDIHSFRMNINLYSFDFQEGAENILKLLESKENEKLRQINRLKNCSTSWYTEDNYLVLDFYVTKETKDAFRHHFETPFELFQIFRLLYELNSHFISKDIKDEVYQSKGFYTNNKLPLGSPEDDVFHFLDFKILKQIKGSNEVKELLLREFSDGEHQFLHTMGICLLLKDRRALLLLDEPETHFNPMWRAKFIKMLKDSIEAGFKEKENRHLLKDILLTSHSPFIISDCMPDNVIFFDRNDESKQVQAKKASAMGFNTYGTSVEIILEELFDYKQSIGDMSNDVIKKINYKSIKSEKDIEKTKKLLSHLGDSIEKDLALARLNQIKF